MSNNVSRFLSITMLLIIVEYCIPCCIKYVDIYIHMCLNKRLNSYVPMAKRRYIILLSARDSELLENLQKMKIFISSLWVEREI